MLAQVKINMLSNNTNHETIFPTHVRPFLSNCVKFSFKRFLNHDVPAISQAFLNAESRPRPAVTSCEHCPMVWFHKLCVEIENVSDRKTQAAILRKLV